MTAFMWSTIPTQRKTSRTDMVDVEVYHPERGLVATIHYIPAEVAAALGGQLSSRGSTHSGAICGAELFIDGPVTFECDLEPGHAGGLHGAKDRTGDGVEYHILWGATATEPADVSCPSCGHCMAHPDDEHEPDCVVLCSVR